MEGNVVFGDQQRQSHLLKNMPPFLHYTGICTGFSHNLRYCGLVCFLSTQRRNSIWFTSFFCSLPPLKRSELLKLLVIIKSTLLLKIKMLKYWFPLEGPKGESPVHTVSQTGESKGSFNVVHSVEIVLICLVDNVFRKGILDTWCQLKLFDPTIQLPSYQCSFFFSWLVVHHTGQWNSQVTTLVPFGPQLPTWRTRAWQNYSLLLSKQSLSLNPLLAPQIFFRPHRSKKMA